MSKIKVIILRTAGTNCDMETAFAFEKVGASADLVHINSLASRTATLDNYQILAIPGGFTYGDDIASGKILANEIKYKLKDEIIGFIKKGKLIIGICNGFQVLVKSGLLPNSAGTFDDIEVTLSINDSGKFEDRWVYLKRQKSEAKGQNCIWTEGIEDIVYLPVAHAEGKFIPRDEKTLESIRGTGLVALTYCDENGKEAKYPANPNGSVEGIAGISDPTGRIFGLMPHPERHIFNTQHPRWTRIKEKKSPDGLAIFENGVKSASSLT
jgi:phosphoribosylformylglycinamidine synthase I